MNTNRAKIKKFLFYFNHYQNKLQLQSTVSSIDTHFNEDLYICNYYNVQKKYFIILVWTPRADDNKAKVWMYNEQFRNTFWYPSSSVTLLLRVFFLIFSVNVFCYNFQTKIWLIKDFRGDKVDIVNKIWSCKLIRKQPNAYTRKLTYDKTKLALENKWKKNHKSSNTTNCTWCAKRKVN